MAQKVPSTHGMKCQSLFRLSNTTSWRGLCLGITGLCVTQLSAGAQVEQSLDQPILLAAIESSSPLDSITSTLPRLTRPSIDNTPSPRSEPATDGAMQSLAHETKQACQARLLQTEPKAQTTPLSVPLMFRTKYVGDISVEVDMHGNGEADGQRIAELLSPLLSRSASDALNVVVGKNERSQFSNFCSGPIRVAFDLGMLELNADAAIDYLGTQPIQFGSAQTPDPSKFDRAEAFSAGIGVTLDKGFNFLDTVGQPEDLKGLIEGYANFGGFGGSALYFGADFDVGRDQTWKRREAFITKDFFENATRLSVGEITAPLTSFQSAAPLLGISFAREFRAIQPFRRTLTTGRGELSLERPSRVEVFANGVLSETLDLLPGRYNLSDFPAAQGSNEIELVIRDDFGRVETQTLNFYSSSQLLSEGLLDFGVTAGVPRTSTQRGFEYDSDPFTTGFINYGLKDWMTLGVNGQSNADRQQVGIEIISGTPFGNISFEAIGSRAEDLLLNTDESVLGHAFGASHQTNFQLGSVPISTNLSILSRSEDFSSLTSSRLSNHRLQAQARVQANLANNTMIGASYGRIDARFGQDDSDRYSLNASKSFKNFSLSLSANHFKSSNGKKDSNVLLSLSVPFGERSNARASYDSRNSRRQLEVSRSGRQQINEFGGRILMEQDRSQDRVDMRGEYIHNRFETALDFRGSSPRNNAEGQRRSQANLQFSSFLGLANGQFAIGRPSPEGFVIAAAHNTLKSNTIEIQNGSGNRTYAKTSRLGNALIPIQRSYLPQEYVAKVHNLPVGYNIGSGRVTTLPSPGAGYVLKIGSAASKSVMGYVVTGDGNPVPRKPGSYYLKRRPEETRQFFTNSAGRFALDQLQAGVYILKFNNGLSTEVTVDEQSEALIDAGTLTAR